MQLILILAVLATLVISENSPAEPVSGAGYRLLAAALGMAVVAVFAVILSELVAKRLRRDFQRRHMVMRLFRTLRRVHLVLWLGVAGGILVWLDWAQLVRFNWHLDRIFLLDDVLILTPVLLPLVLSWAAFYEVDHALHVGMAEGASQEGPRFDRGEYLAVHLRHYLGVLLIPVLGMLAFQDAVELVAPGIVGSDYQPLVYGPPIVLLFLLFPVLLRHVWRTRPLAAGPLRDRLEAAARRAGFRAKDILVWQTGRMVVNAAVAGLLPPWRYVFLTDGLLAQLADEEIEVVFGHEIGHVRHRHLLLRVLAMMAPVSLCLVAVQVFPRVAERWEDWIAGSLGGSQIPAGMLMLLAMALYVLVVFGAYSRLLEGQADLFGCRSLPSASRARSLETFISALEKLAHAGGTDRNTSTWQHASIARRISFLVRVSRDPNRELRFQRRVRLVGTLVIGIVLSPLAYQFLLG